MDTSDGYRGGSRGFQDRGGRPYQDNYQRGDGGYRGGGNYRGGGRGQGYSDRQDWNTYDRGGRGGYQGQGYQGQWQPPREYQGGDFYQGGGRGRRGGRGGGGRRDWGRGNRDNYRWQRDAQGQQEEALAPDVKALTELSGHTQKVAAIIYEPASQLLYTGSSDGTVKTWNTVTGQVVSSVEVGGEVDSLLIGGGYLFVGMHKGGEGIIKVWNMTTGANHLLTGHKGAVLALAIANTALVSAGQDNTIRVWNFNQQAGIFMSHAIITKEDGGHASSVHALAVMGNHMFSADRVGSIVVWDLATGKAVQRIPSAHGDQPVMQLLPFESYLISAGMDGLIRAWQVLDPPLPAMVLRPDPDYAFDKENPDSGPDAASSNSHMGPGRQRRRVPPGVVTMAGTTDPAGTPVLMVVYNGETCVRLYQLPDFGARGVLRPAADTRSLGSVAGTVMLTGDSTGVVRVFQWLQPT